MLEIHSVEKYKGRTYQVNFTDGEPAFINAEIISQYHVRADSAFTEEEWQEVIFANDFRRARERAMYLLDYRDYSYVELYKKLLNNYDEDICYAVLDKLSELGFVDDRRYAESLARKYMEIKRFGYYRAVQEMRLKGLSKDLIDDVLSEYDDSTIDRLVELIEKKYARYLYDDGGIKKVKNALARYGYSYGDINAAIDEIMEEDDE